jgi:hypothetical protein
VHFPAAENHEKKGEGLKKGGFSGFVEKKALKSAFIIFNKSKILFAFANLFHQKQ